jgi:transposase
MPTIPPLVITDEERAELQRRVRAHTTPQRTATRARIVLLAADDGLPNRQIALMVDMNEHTVAQWRRRFETERHAGLQDRKRPGRPLVYDHDQRLRMVATLTQQPPDLASHWSHSQLATALADMGISDPATRAGVMTPTSTRRAGARTAQTVSTADRVRQPTWPCQPARWKAPAQAW